MAFGLDKKILTEQLENLGASVVVDEGKHRLIVNDKYEICYTNNWYRYKGSNKTIGQGKQEFMDLIKNEMLRNPIIMLDSIKDNSCTDEA